MSPSITSLRHSHSECELSIRRSRVMSDHFIAPGCLRMSIRPSLVTSLYSIVSVSDSIPETLRKLPISTLSISSTKTDVVARSGFFSSSGELFRSALLRGRGAPLPLADPEHDELGRFHRGEPDV